jgi:hypothetical protein
MLRWGENVINGHCAVLMTFAGLLEECFDYSFLNVRTALLIAEFRLDETGIHLCLSIIVESFADNSVYVPIRTLENCLLNKSWNRGALDCRVAEIAYRVTSKLSL